MMSKSWQLIKYTSIVVM